MNKTLLDMFEDGLNSSTLEVDDNPNNVTDARNENLARVEVGTLALIFGLIVVGNFSVLIALIAGRIKMRRMYYFMLHLSIADMVTGFFTVLPQLCWDITYRFYGGNFMCKSIKFLQLLGPYLSSYVLVVTAIDRYQAICHPLANCSWTPKRSKLMIAVAWITSLVCCSPQLFIFSYQEVSEDVYDCWGTFPQPWGERVYVTWYAITVFFIPLLVLTFTYVCICREIWINAKRNKKFSKTNYAAVAINTTNAVADDSNSEGSSNQTSTRRPRMVVEVGYRSSYRFRRNQRNGNIKCYLEDTSTSDSTQSEATSSRQSINKLKVNITPRIHCGPGKLSRAKIKTIKITVVVIFCYVFCSLPFICVQLWAYWYPSAQTSVLWTGPFITIAMLLSSLNSCVNPWIYLFFNRNLWLTLKRICCLPCMGKGMRHKPTPADFNSSLNSDGYHTTDNNSSRLGHLTHSTTTGSNTFSVQRNLSTRMLAPFDPISLSSSTLRRLSDGSQYSASVRGNSFRETSFNR